MSLLEGRNNVVGSSPGVSCMHLHIQGKLPMEEMHQHMEKRLELFMIDKSKLSSYGRLLRLPLICKLITQTIIVKS